MSEIFEGEDEPLVNEDFKGLELDFSFSFDNQFEFETNNEEQTKHLPSSNCQSSLTFFHDEQNDSPLINDNVDNFTEMDEINNKNAEKTHELELEEDENHLSSNPPPLLTPFSYRSFLRKIIFFEYFQNDSVKIFLILLVITFEVTLISAGFLVGKPFTICFCLMLICFPIFWIYLIYFRSNDQRNSTPFPRIIETFAIGFFLESILFFIEWTIGYVGMAIAIDLYFAIDNYYLLWFLIFSTIVFSSFILQSLMEETTKFFILYRNSQTIGFTSQYSIVIYSITASIAMAFLSGTLSTVLIYWQNDVIYALATLLIEGFLTTTMHVITGTWIGIGFVKYSFKGDDLSDFHSHPLFLLPPFILHGLYCCLISSLRMLYPIGDIDWTVYLSIVFAASLFLLFSLLLTFFYVRDIFHNPRLYHLLSR